MKGNPGMIFMNCTIEHTGNSLLENEKVLIKNDKYIFGPVNVIKNIGSKSIILADEDYNIYKRIESEEVDINKLTALNRIKYEPVTNSIYLDGFLGTTFYDESSDVLRTLVNIPSIKEYYAIKMDENNIEYASVQDGFIIKDENIIEEIYKRQPNNPPYGMPAQYAIGVLSSFVINYRIRVNSNPKHAKYEFNLYKEEELYNELAPLGLFYSNSRGIFMFSIFCSFEPFTYCIDSIVDVEDSTPQDIHNNRVFVETTGDIIVKMFSVAGYSTRILKRDYDYIKFSINKIGNSNQLTKNISIINFRSNKDGSSDYNIFLEDRTPYIAKVKISDNHCYFESEVDLVYSDLLNLSSECRDFFTILFKKL